MGHAAANVIGQNKETAERKKHIFSILNWLEKKTLISWEAGDTASSYE